MPPMPAPHAEGLLKHADFVRALAFATLRGDPESEDVAQDAWLAALQHAPEDPDHQRSWFARVIRNRAAELFRSRGRRARREQVAAERRTPVSATDALAEQAETGRRLVGAVLALEEPFRTAILLRFHEDLPPREVAQRLGVPVETVRSRVRRGLERLRALLEENEAKGGRDWRAALAGLLPGRALVGTAGGTAALAVGGALMKKIAVVGLVVLLAGTGVWFVGGAGERKERESTAGERTAEPLASGGPALGASTTAPSLDAAGSKPRARPTEEPPSTGPNRDIRGLVVDEAGRPVAGAVVRVVKSVRDFLQPGRSIASAEPASHEPVRTDGDGHFTFPQRGGTFSSGLSVRAEAPGLVQRDRYKHAPLGQETRIELRAGVATEIAVVDAGGAPVAGATVQAFTDPATVSYGADAQEEARTDAFGRARFTLFPGSIRFVAKSPGKGFAESREVLALPAHSVRMHLQPAGHVDGIVLRADGRPAGDVVVMLLRFPSEQRAATTDAGGRFRFEDVPSRELSVAGSKGQQIVVLVVETDPNLPRQWFTADAPPGGETREVRLQLSEPRTLAGTLRHPDGSPAAGVAWAYGREEGKVEWGWTRHAGPAPGREGVTDAAGRFRAEGLPAGRFLLWFGKPFPDEATFGVDVPTDRDPAPLDVTFDDPSRTLRVVVLDANGNGVSDATAVLFGPGVRGKRVQANTSREGVARLRASGAPPWMVGVDARRAAPVLVPVSPALASDPGSGEVVVRLGNDVLEGQVRDLDGQPVQLWLRLALPAVLGPDATEFAGGQVTSDAEGRFRFTGLSSVVYGIRGPTHVGAHRVVDEEFQYRAGDRGVVVRVASATEVAALTLAVEVADDTGRGLLSGVEVTAEPSGGGRPISFEPETTAGMFTARRLAAPGRWTIRASGEALLSAEVEVEVTAAAPLGRQRLVLRRR